MSRIWCSLAADLWAAGGERSRAGKTAQDEDAGIGRDHGRQAGLAAVATRLDVGAVEVDQGELGRHEDAGADGQQDAADEHDDVDDAHEAHLVAWVLTE